MPPELASIVDEALRLKNAGEWTPENAASMYERLEGFSKANPTEAEGFMKQFFTKASGERGDYAMGVDLVDDFIKSYAARGGRIKAGKVCLEIEGELPDGSPLHQKFSAGDSAAFPFPAGDKNAKLVLKPSRGFNVGAGPGKALEAEVEGGTAGIVVDCRGRRPFVIPEDAADRVTWLKSWTEALDAYPVLEE